MNEKTWSEPFYGISHYGNSSDMYRSTVAQIGSLVELSKWFPGCQFSPLCEVFTSLDDAKIAGEKWANQTLRAG